MTFVVATEQIFAAREEYKAAKAVFAMAFPKAIAEYARESIPTATAVVVRYSECGGEWHVAHAITPNGDVAMGDDEMKAITRAFAAIDVSPGNVPGGIYVNYTETRIEFAD